MSTYIGTRLRLSIFGQSHGKAIGMSLEGIPAGLPVDLDTLQRFLNRRAPGQSDLTTARTEADVPEFLSGLVNDHSCGAPIAAVIQNRDIREKAYAPLRDCPRPGHADYTAQIKYGGCQDASGGGHFSGRLTAPLCIAGGLCLQWLGAKGIAVEGRLVSVGIVTDPAHFDEEILAAKAMGDSVGAVIECTVTGLPAGLGGPMFDGLESKLAPVLFGIPGIKGVEFGSGFSGAATRGSENNDAFYINNGRISTRTNHCGGILGGISTGGPLVFRVALKPAPSISLPQETISFRQMKGKILEITGRHDPCIGVRALPVVEAAAALVLFDELLSN